MGLPEDICKKYKFHEDGYGDPNAEGRVIAVELDDFFIVNVYTPNSKPDLSRLNLRHKQWDPAFLEYIKNLQKKKPVIFCGDLNVAHTPDDLANPKQNEGEHGFTKEEREGIDQNNCRRVCRHVPPLHSQGQRALHVVDALAQCPGAQHRLAHRLLVCLKVPSPPPKISLNPSAQ